MFSHADESRLVALRELSRTGGPLSPDAPTATINNPIWWDSAGPTAIRDELHERLISDARSAVPDLKQERRAISMAGPPGAGKGYARKQLLGERERHFLIIDADNFTESLLPEAIRDGTYDSDIVPGAVRDHPQIGAIQQPLELASLVHEESSYLAKRSSFESIRAGDNVVIDTVLGSADKARRISAQLEAAGYDVQVVDVEVPFEVSEARIRQRWLDGNEAARRGEGLGGRWVPSDFARNVFDGPDGRSRPEANARMVAEESPAVSWYRVYRTSAEQAEVKAGPTLETDMSRATRGGPLVPTRSGPAAEVPQARVLPGIARAGRTTPGRAGPARVDRGR
ncbi:zeta toxin family protein [Clavibacter sp. VKM Ac-2872]|uniref:zeta toxin family protein n=1 Tax=Clavibacter sp. VKM Ac-2872 TaxID=2783812 RepID=UPI00351B4BD6